MTAHVPGRVTADELPGRVAACARAAAHSVRRLDVAMALNELVAAGAVLPLVVIYDRPLDAPAHVVVRLWDGERPTSCAWTFPTIEEARASIPDWLVRLEPHRDDDPKILEVWL
jgi:hypothetical protein